MIFFKNQYVKHLYISMVYNIPYFHGLVDHSTIILPEEEY